MTELRDLKPNPRNPRKITPAKLKMLAKAMEEFGDLSGIVFNKTTDRLAGGHQRLVNIPKDAVIEIVNRYDPPTRQGTVEEGYITFDGQRWNYRAVEWDENKEKAANLAANKGAGEFDQVIVSEWLLDLDSANYDMDLTMFDASEREDIVVPVEKLEPGCDEDEAPEPPKEPVSKLGDLFILGGKHRLLCGDSTDILQVERLMDGEKADMVFTDPPYNVGFNGRSGNFEVIKNDDLSNGQFRDFIAEVCNTIKAIGAPTYYVWCNWKFYGVLQEFLPFKACIVWAKNVFGLGKGYRHQHEFCLFNGTLDSQITNESDLWEVKKDALYEHPTQKPTALAERALRNHKDAINILDLFGGSGSTLVAGEKCERSTYLMELDPRYVDVIVNRFIRYAGKSVYLVNEDGSQTSWTDLAKEREGALVS